MAVIRIYLCGHCKFFKTSLVETTKSLPRAYLAVFLILTVVWVYSTTIVAINPNMAYYGSGRGFTAILVGLAAAALKRLHGERFTTSIIWAIFCRRDISRAILDLGICS